MDQNNQGAQAPEAQPAQPVQPAQPANAAPVEKAPQAPQLEPPVAAQAPVVQPAVPSPSPEPDRTGQQFDKLVDSNKRLYEANQLLQQALTERANSNATFAPATQQGQQAPQQRQQPAQPQVPQGQQAPQVTDFIETNPATGEQYINRTKFEAAYSEVNQRAKRAEEVVTNYIQQAEAREVDRQNRDAWQAYPELNPGSKTFDARFSQQARAIIYDSMINPQDYGGRPLGFRDAADYLKGGTKPEQQEALTAPVAPVMDPVAAEKNQTAKEQASLAATPQPQQASTFESQDEAYGRLVMGTRTGSDEALARRLLNSPHKLEDIEAAVAAK